MKIARDQYALDTRHNPVPRLPEFATRNNTYMESDSGKRAKESGVRDRRYSIRYPFASGAEMLELESGTRVSGVTSDLSLGGCFVCWRRTLELRARVAVIRVVKPRVGMGLEFLDIDRDSNAALLAWIESQRKPQ